MATDAPADPQKAWARLGRKAQRDVSRRAAKGELHPHPEVRDVSVSWARYLVANKQRLLKRHVAAFVPSWLIGIGAVYLLTRLVGWNAGGLVGAAIALAVFGVQTWMIEMRAARRIVAIAGEGDS